MYGWPVLVHYCDTCHYNTTIDYSPTVWSQDHACRHCGVSAPGADLAGSSPVEMNQIQHDELAQLFAQHMQVSPQHHLQQQQRSIDQHLQDQPVQPSGDTVPHLVQPVPAREPEKQDVEPIHFISTHYNPNAAHIRPDTTSEPSRSPPPPYNENVMPEALADLLRQNSIDPAALLPNQIHLFQNADQEQRSRLLELWRIAPPSYPLEEHLHGTWVGTSVEREETLARVRYEEQQKQQTHQTQVPQPQSNGFVSMTSRQEDYGLDTFIPPGSEPISPIREPGEDPWPPAARMKVAAITAAAHSRSQSRTDMAEPYILNGYSPAPQALDPVYAAAAGVWSVPAYVEDQYGMYEQIRNHADWERRNEILAREKMMAAQHGGGDDYDMEL